MIGNRLGHYRIEQRLGAGGMGEVFLARDERLDRNVAIKVLGDADPRAETLLLQEAKAASALNHPGICTIHEVGRSGDTAYIVMESIDGATLGETIPPGGMATERIHDLTRQIAEALAHAHERGVVHRDLKSANIMLTRDGRVKILDFGLARRLSPDETEVTRTLTSASRDESIAGTLAYMAPEVLSGQPASTQSDIWALGILLHEMTAGSLPFTGPTSFEVTAAILREAPPPLPGRLGRSLQRVVRRCLSKEPWKRYRDAGELLIALDTVADSDTRWDAGDGGEDSGGPIRGLVVLPFANLSQSPEQDYFVDGLTEAVTSGLARVAGLRVISRTSAMQYKATPKPVPEIARDLRVDGVVEGSVFRSGERVRVSVQLVHAPADKLLWSETYDRELSDILGVLTDISKAVAQEIASKVVKETHDERRVNPNAYEAYLKGRFAWNLRNDSALRKGITFFQKAIEHDPTYAQAYSGIADCYNVLGFQGSDRPDVAFPRAKAAAEQALAIDPKLGDAWCSLAYAELHYRWNWEGARIAFQQGVELNPNYATGYHWYALYFGSLGKQTEAMTMMSRARELDPLSLIIGVATAWLLCHFREYDAAIEAYRRTLEMNPDFWWGRVWMANTYVHKGMLAEALSEFQRALDPLNRHPGLLSCLAFCLGKLGDLDEVGRIEDEITRRAGSAYVRPCEFARLALARKDPDSALGWLEKGYAEGGNWLGYLRVDPHWDELRPDPRFEHLVQRVYHGAPPKEDST